VEVNCAKVRFQSDREVFEQLMDVRERRLLARGRLGRSFWISVDELKMERAKFMKWCLKWAKRKRDTILLGWKLHNGGHEAESQCLKNLVLYLECLMIPVMNYFWSDSVSILKEAFETCGQYLELFQIYEMEKFIEYFEGVEENLIEMRDYMKYALKEEGMTPHVASLEMVRNKKEFLEKDRRDKSL
jgi:hypothetical protein